MSFPIEKRILVQDPIDDHDNPPNAMIHLASDIGGTFTDFVWIDEHQNVHTRKKPSDETHPARPVLDAMEDIQPDVHSHGTTVATNAMLERTGARVAFVTTEGFRDVLHIARQDRPELYNPESTRTSPLVDRDHLLEVDERTGPDGRIIDPLEPSDLKDLKKKLDHLNPDAVAVCLLHSYANPEHEQKISEALTDFRTSCSSNVLPQFREYERASSTVTNAYLDPVVRDYVQTLDQEAHPLFLMKSSEGVGSVEQVLDRPLQLLLSGPAGGAIAGAQLGQKKDAEKVINIDMGGTSADISLVVDGEPLWTSSTTIDELPVGLPMIDVETIGAGGGSIARFDEAGALQVGPESAGSDPGPICYDRGGNKLTVTDAHLVLGHVGPETELAEQLSLAPDRTLEAFEEKCKETSMSVPKLANGILDVVNSRMTRAIRSVLMKHGHDPSQFRLVVFGGAGPLHACDLAERLDISTVFVPNHPGVFSATGVLQANQTAHKSQTILQRFSGMTEDIQSVLEELEDEALRELDRTTPPFNGSPHIRSSLDLRYEGQSYEITLNRSNATPKQFHKTHEQRYGYKVPGEQIEVVNARAKASLTGSSIDGTHRSSSGEPSPDSRSPLFHDPFNSFKVFQRSNLSHGQVISEPATVEEMSGTTRIKSGWTAEVHPDGTLELTPGAGT